MKGKGWLVVLALLVLSLAGCRRGGSGDISDIGIGLTVSPSPPEVGAAIVSLSLSDAEGQAITGAEVELEGNMSHAGMTPVFSEAEEVAPGQYEAPLEFTMGGDWFILVKVRLSDGRELERQIDVPGVASP